MYAIATKVTSPPRTSRENVDPLLLISKNESTRLRKVGLARALSSQSWSREYTIGGCRSVHTLASL